METTTDLLTLEKLKELDKYSIIAHGITTNDPEGIYMTNSDKGRKLIWVAKRGYIPDWTIYIHWADNGLDYVLDYGDKVISPANIKKLVPCDDEAFKMYRY